MHYAVLAQQVALQLARQNTSSLEDSIRSLCGLICEDGDKTCRRQVTAACAQVNTLQESLVDLALHRWKRGRG